MNENTQLNSILKIKVAPTMQKLIDMKVDGIITDKPSELKKLNSVN